MRFVTTLRTSGKTATGLRVPDDIVEALGHGKRPPVRVTINGYTYRSTIAVMRGIFMIGVSAEHRAGAGVEGGDTLEVEIELDTAPRTVEVPPALAEALASDPEATRFFESLSYSKQLWFVLQITGAKTEETRRRRLDKTIEMLRDRRTR
jgi:hypothetical protein